MLNWDDPIASVKSDKKQAYQPQTDEDLESTLQNYNTEDTDPESVVGGDAASPTPDLDAALAEAPTEEQAGVTGLEQVEFGANRLSVDDKKMINCRADVNQLVPFKYKWAWQKYLDACANHWMPQEINMNADIALWKSQDGLTDDERTIIKRNLGFFSTADSLVANRLGRVSSGHESGMPPVPATSGLRGSRPHACLSVLRRIAGLGRGRGLQHVPRDPVGA